MEKTLLRRKEEKIKNQRRNVEEKRVRVRLRQTAMACFGFAQRSYQVAC
jgi:hypothetical protein